MGRKKKHRCCEFYKNKIVYKPVGIPMQSISVEYISPDEFESMRLCDLNDLTQEEAGVKMGVSRGTVQRLLYSGRKKLIRALMENRGIIISENDKKEEIYESMFSSES